MNTGTHPPTFLLNELIKEDHGQPRSQYHMMVLLGKLDLGISHRCLQNDESVGYVGTIESRM